MSKSEVTKRKVRSSVQSTPAAPSNAFEITRFSLQRPTASPLENARTYRESMAESGGEMGEMFSISIRPRGCLSSPSRPAAYPAAASSLSLRISIGRPEHSGRYRRVLATLKQFAERGWEADVGFIRPDETAGPAVQHLLASKSYDYVVIGAGVRLPPRRVATFEAVINAVHKAAPGAAIAFNTRPEDSADAAAR
jgi:hypothetical protein